MCQLRGQNQTDDTDYACTIGYVRSMHGINQFPSNLHKPRHEDGNYPELSAECQLQLPYHYRGQRQDVEVRDDIDCALNLDNYPGIDTERVGETRSGDANGIQSPVRGNIGKIERNLCINTNVYHPSHRRIDVKDTEIEQ